MHSKTRRAVIKTMGYAALAGLSSLFGVRSFGFKSDNPPAFKPNYLNLHKSGELKQRGEKLWAMMEACELCPRMCGVNKLEGEKGFCQANAQLEISAYQPHFGEEKPLVGRGGSGTIFLTNCGLRCVFCINWEISWGGRGKAVDVENMVFVEDDLVTLMHAMESSLVQRIVHDAFQEPLRTLRDSNPEVFSPAS